MKDIKILVVDDESTVRKTVEKILKREGFEVEGAIDGYDALSKAKESEFDLIITDINMPEMNGIETIKGLREINPNYKIIIMTGMESNSNLIEAIRVGVNDYIYKPFDMEEFIHRVKKTVEIIKLESKNKKLEEENLKNYKMAAIGDMTNSIVHDMKNSMTVIVGFARLLKKEDIAKEKVGEFTEIILRQSDQVLGQLKEVLDFSRGEGNYDMEIVNIRKLFNITVEENIENYRMDKIDISAEFDETLLNKSVVIDKGRIKQVFFNLFSNSKDALMGKEKKRIEVIFKNENSEKLVIKFKDFGKGIKEENLTKIFEPFTSFGKKHGTGLGLAIVKQIIEKCNGKIFVKSKLEEWTEFCIELPIENI